MAILVMCSNPQCGELFEVDDQAAGTDVSCPSCGVSQQAGPADGGRAATRQQAAPTPAPTDLPEPAEQGGVRPEPVTAEELFADEPAAAGLAEQAGGQAAPASPTAARRRHVEPDRAQEDASLAGPDAAEHAFPAQPGRRAETAGPPGETDLTAELDSILSPLDGQSTDQASPAEFGVEAVMEYRGVTAMIFLVGLFGIGAGFVGGFYCLPFGRVVGGYLGAAAGWVAGFLLAFLLLLANKAQASRLRCSVCKKVFPVGTEVCNWCGSVLSGPELDPLVADCLRAGAYALSNRASLYWMSLLLATVAALVFGILEALRRFPAELASARPGLIGLCWLIGFLTFAHWLRYLLETIGGTVNMSDRVGSAPRYWSFRNVGLGLVGLGVLAAYVLPMLTMPLLPLGLLAISGSRKGIAFNLPAVVRAAWRNAKDFALMWLLLLLWSSGLALTAALAAALWYGMSVLVPPSQDISGIAMSIAFLAVTAGLAGAAGTAFALAMFRCIGLFARRNGKTLYLLASGGRRTPA